MKFNYLIIGIATVLFSTILTACADKQDQTSSVVKFDKQAWLLDKGKSSRQRMIKGLEKELKLGMSSKQVIELMGEPGNVIDRKSEKSYIYDLGKGLIDYQEYRVIFDDNWKVTEFMELQG